MPRSGQGAVAGDLFMHRSVNCLHSSIAPLGFRLPNTTLLTDHIRTVRAHTHGGHLGRGKHPHILFGHEATTVLTLRHARVLIQHAYVATDSQALLTRQEGHPVSRKA